MSRGPPVGLNHHLVMFGIYKDSYSYFYRWSKIHRNKNAKSKRRQTFALVLVFLVIFTFFLSFVCESVHNQKWALSYKRLRTPVVIYPVMNLVNMRIWTTGGSWRPLEVGNYWVKKKKKKILKHTFVAAFHFPCFVFIFKIYVKLNLSVQYMDVIRLNYWKIY